MARARARATSPLLPRVALHSIALYSCYYAFASLSTIEAIIGVPIHKQYAGHFQFLTICGLSITTATMLLGLLTDLVPITPLFMLKQVLHAIALPTESAISALYWGLLTFNPSLLMPPGLTVRVPLAIDAALHAWPGVFLLVDYLLLSPPFPTHIHPATLAAATALAYAAWAEFVATKNGHFAYPLLDILSTPQRMLLYTSCTAASAASTYLYAASHRAINNPRKQHRGKSD